MDIVDIANTNTNAAIAFRFRWSYVRRGGGVVRGEVGSKWSLFLFLINIKLFVCLISPANTEVLPGLSLVIKLLSSNWDWILDLM